MEAIRPNLQAQPKILKKKMRTPNLPIITKNLPKKVFLLYLKSLKEPKIRMRATRPNLQAQPKILKKLLEHQTFQSKRKFSQKKYV
jgi:hypothetical protein